MLEVIQTVEKCLDLLRTRRFQQLLVIVPAIEPLKNPRYAVDGFADSAAAPVPHQRNRNASRPTQNALREGC
jgi:hypothetical protein